MIHLMQMGILSSAGTAGPSLLHTPGQQQLDACTSPFTECQLQRAASESL